MYFGGISNRVEFCILFSEKPDRRLVTAKQWGWSRELGPRGYCVGPQAFKAARAQRKIPERGDVSLGLR